MAEEQSLILIKPDAVQRGLIGTIIARLEAKGLRIAALQMRLADERIAREHYAEHAEKPFFPKLLAFITSAPVVALVVAGDSAISTVRLLVGGTDARTAAPGTIRGDLGLSKSANLIHASDSAASAEREIGIWFPDGVLDWEAGMARYLVG
ncbi:MAG: nucleoside-diphosphate kinase [Planctomycetota bacterium]